MTLFRQIALLFALGYLVAMLILGWNDFNKSTRIMQGQMETAAQDMATTAGIAISSLLRNGDAVAVDTVFSAIFDSGYYSTLKLVTSEGEVLASRSQELRVPDVPDWFVSLVEIEPARGETQVANGWVPYGTLSVTLHPGYAYARLYDNLRSLLVWLLALSLLGVGVLWWLLYRLLAPLRATVAQADAICENRFVRQERLPRTRELRHVVEAINRMVGKVQQVWDEQAETLQRYHDMQYRDELTGLGNRRHFTTRLDEYCNETGKVGSWLAIIHLHNLVELNRQLGHQATDELLKAIGKLLGDSPLVVRDGECARMNSSEFGVLLGGGRDRLDDFVSWLFTTTSAQLQERGAGELSWIALGVIELDDHCQMSKALAAADYALAQARAAGPWSVEVGSLDVDKTLPKGKLAWQSWLRDALDQDRIFLAGQRVLGSQGECYHHELFVRLRSEQGRVVSAGSFMPMAAMLDLAYRIDQRVLSKALQVARKSPDIIALNLSPNVLSDACALADFENFLYQFAALNAAGLHVEVSHHVLNRHPTAALHLAELLRRYGFALGIEHLDLGDSLELVRQVAPQYIKINARRLDDILLVSGADPLQPMRSLLQSMEITLIAVGVDDDELRQRLQQAGFNVMLGHIISPVTEYP